MQKNTAVKALQSPRWHVSLVRVQKSLPLPCIVSICRVSAAYKMFDLLFIISTCWSGTLCFLTSTSQLAAYFLRDLSSPFWIPATQDNLSAISPENWTALLLPPLGTHLVQKPCMIKKHQFFSCNLQRSKLKGRIHWNDRQKLSRW